MHLKARMNYKLKTIRTRAHIRTAKQHSLLNEFAALDPFTFPFIKTSGAVNSCDYYQEKHILEFCFSPCARSKHVFPFQQSWQVKNS